MGVGSWAMRGSQVLVTKRRLVAVTGAAAVPAVAVAAALGWWPVAVTIVAALQFAVLYGVLDTRRRMLRPQALRKVAAHTKHATTLIDSVGTRLLATTESARVEAADRFSELDRALDESRAAVAGVEKTVGDLVTELDARRRDADDVRGRLDAHEEQFDDARRSLTSIDERLTGVGTDLSHVAEKQDKRELAALSRNLRQTEALIQIYARIQPRCAMPSSGGWGLDPTGILALVELVQRRRPRTVLEFGSGTSTIWLGYALETVGAGRVVSVDHDEKYATRTRELVERHGLESFVDVRLAPLTDAGLPEHATQWYDVASVEDVTSVDLLVIDGPPKAVGSMSRYPAVPKLVERLAAGAVIVLDDATRPDEKEVAARWAKEHPTLREIRIAPGDDLKILERPGLAAEDAE